MPEPIVTLNGESLKIDLLELVRMAAEDALNGLLEEEAGDLVGAERHRRPRLLPLPRHQDHGQVLPAEGPATRGRGAQNSRKR